MGDVFWYAPWRWKRVPPNTAFSAGAPAGGNGMANPPMIGRCVIPRHAWRSPSSAPRNFDLATKLPGAINMGMFDGHVELVKLENLWNYYWHFNYVPPSKRPGS